MNKISSLAELISKRDELAAAEKNRSNEISKGGRIVVRVHMGTSGIASGAKEIFEFINSEIEKRNIDAMVIRTGDMGYCFAEPTIEVTLPGRSPVVFGNVDKVKADEIIQRYMRNGELVEGILPVNYRTI